MTIRVLKHPGMTFDATDYLARLAARDAGYSGAKFLRSQRIPGGDRYHVYTAVTA